MSSFRLQHSSGSANIFRRSTSRFTQAECAATTYTGDSVTTGANYLNSLAEQRSVKVFQEENSERNVFDHEWQEVLMTCRSSEIILRRLESACRLAGRGIYDA